MHHRKTPWIRFLASGGALLSAGTVFATEFTTGYDDSLPPDNGVDGHQAGEETNQANGWGMTFTPNVGASIDDASIPAIVYLQDWTMTTSSSGFSLADDVFLSIYDVTGDVILNQDPSSFSAANYVGSSTNEVDMAALGAVVENGEVVSGTPTDVTWIFDNLALAKDRQYAVVFAADQDATFDELTSAVELNVGNPYAGGQFVRHNGSSTDWDPEFTATLNTVIPEPASLSLVGMSSLALLRRRRGS